MGLHPLESSVFPGALLQQLRLDVRGANMQIAYSSDHCRVALAFSAVSSTCLLRAAAIAFHQIKYAPSLLSRIDILGEQPSGGANHFPDGSFTRLESSAFPRRAGIANRNQPTRGQGDSEHSVGSTLSATRWRSIRRWPSRSYLNSQVSWEIPPASPDALTNKRFACALKRTSLG